MLALETRARLIRLWVGVLQDNLKHTLPLDAAEWSPAAVDLRGGGGSLHKELEQACIQRSAQALQPVLLSQRPRLFLSFIPVRPDQPAVLVRLQRSILGSSCAAAPFCEMSQQASHSLHSTASQRASLRCFWRPSLQQALLAGGSNLLCLRISSSDAADLGVQKGVQICVEAFNTRLLQAQACAVLNPAHISCRPAAHTVCCTNSSFILILTDGCCGGACRSSRACLRHSRASTLFQKHCALC